MFFISLLLPYCVCTCPLRIVLYCTVFIVAPLVRIKIHIYLSHDLDLSGSRDVIGHVIIRLPIGHFLLAVIWIGSKPLSPAIFEILGSSMLGSLTSLTFNGHVTPAISHVTIRYFICYFLWWSFETKNLYL